MVWALRACNLGKHFKLVTNVLTYDLLAVSSVCLFCFPSFLFACGISNWPLLKLDPRQTVGQGGYGKGSLPSITFKPASNRSMTTGVYVQLK